MYTITLQNIKQSVKNLGEFFSSKGYDIPHSTLLHGLSKALFFPNWNTLKAHCEQPQEFAAEEYYVLRFQSNQSKHTVLTVLEQCAQKANSCIHVSRVVEYPQFLEIRFTNPLVQKDGRGYSNLAVALVFFAQHCVEHNWKVGRLEYWHQRLEQQNFVSAVHDQKPELKM